MAELAPYNINIYVYEGDPNGVRVITRFGWTGKAIVFPRDRWDVIRSRTDFKHAGVYILLGEDDHDEDGPATGSQAKPLVYIGESDQLGERLNHHANNRDNWTWAIAFTAEGSTLNKAHVQWLEEQLIARAQQVNRARVTNSVQPKPNLLAEHEVANLGPFLEMMLSIMPLVGINAFVPGTVVAAPATSTPTASANARSAAPDKTEDTLIVPGNEEGVRETFLGEHRWYAVRIASWRIENLKWIAVYQTAPISAITHLAPIEAIRRWGDSGKYEIVCQDTPEALASPVILGDALPATMQGPRYAYEAEIRRARQLSDLSGFSAR